MKEMIGRIYEIRGSTHSGQQGLYKTLRMFVIEGRDPERIDDIMFCWVDWLPHEKQEGIAKHYPDLFIRETWDDLCRQRLGSKFAKTIENNAHHGTPPPWKEEWKGYSAIERFMLYMDYYCDTTQRFQIVSVHYPAPSIRPLRKKAKGPLFQL